MSLGMLISVGGNTLKSTHQRKSKNVHPHLETLVDGSVR